MKVNVLGPSDITNIILEKKERGVANSIKMASESIRIKSTGAVFNNKHHNSLLSMAGMIDGICDKIIVAGTMGHIVKGYFDNDRKSLRVVINEPSVIKDIDLIFA